MSFSRITRKIKHAKHGNYLKNLSSEFDVKICSSHQIYIKLLSLKTIPNDNIS